LRTTLLYTNLTPKTVHSALLEKGWDEENLPTIQTIANMLDRHPGDIALNQPAFPLTFLCRPKKSNKRNPPCAAESPLRVRVSVAWAKTRWLKWRAEISCTNNFLNNRKDIGIYPLKQFAHVIHGNPNPQGRTAMGSPSPNGIRSFGKKASLHGKFKEMNHDGERLGCLGCSL
jgi:hypothetical protein